jgi:hypothetical protein
VAGASPHFLLDPFLDGVRDRERLAARRAVADDEVVGEDLQGPEVEDDEPFRFLVLGGLDGEGEFPCQRRASFR